VTGTADYHTFLLAVPLPVLADWFLPVWDIGNCVGTHMVIVL